jgi:thioredoxin
MIKKITYWFISAIMSVTVVSCGAGTPGNSSKDNISLADNEKGIKTIHLTKAEFLKKVVNYETNSKEWKYLGDKPAIIDFYATWCGPCKTLAPILEDLANEYEGQIYIYKIDTDKEQELASAFGISAIPTILFVPMVGKPQISQGALPKDNLKEIIEKILLDKKGK